MKRDDILAMASLAVVIFLMAIVGVDECSDRRDILTPSTYEVKK